MRSYSVWLSLSDLFHLPLHPQGQSILLLMAGFPCFLWLNNTILYMVTTHCLFIYPLRLLCSHMSGAAEVRPNRDKVAGQERNLQGSSSPRGCPRGPVCPFLLPVLLLLGFLLIFGNIIYSNKASLEKSKPFWKWSWLLWLRTWP